jgi:hypothetical protein
MGRELGMSLLNIPYRIPLKKNSQLRFKSKTADILARPDLKCGGGCLPPVAVDR